MRPHASLKFPISLHLLKPQKTQSLTSSATVRHLSAEPQHPHPPPLLQTTIAADGCVSHIVSLLQTTEPDDWPTNTDLHRSLFTSPPISPLYFLKISRQLGSSQKSLQFFDYLKNGQQLNSSASSPERDPSALSFTFQAVLEHALREEHTNSPARLKELFMLARDQNVPLSIKSANLLIRCFGQAKMFGESFAVFNALSPDARSSHVVNPMLNFMLKAGRVDDALKLLDEMLNTELKSSPISDTVEIVLSAALKRNWSGRSMSEEEMYGVVLMFAERGCFPNKYWLTQLITKFCRSRKCDKAWELLHELMRLGVQVEAPSCNALLSGLGKEQDFQKMNLLMKEMKEKEIQPDVVTFGILINYLCKFHRVDEAMEVFERMRGGDESEGISVEPDIVLYNTLINGLCKVGRQEEGLGIMEKMNLQQGCKPNTVTYNSLIDGFCKVGEIEKSLELFDQMNKDGVEPNVITLNILLNGMCKCGCVSSAMQFFNEMQEKGLKGNATTYTVLISAYCGANNIEKAMKLFDQMLESGSSPDAIVYYSLISGLSQAGRMDDASFIVSKMREAGFQLDVISYNVLIGGFCRKKKFDKACELFQDMDHAGVKPDRITYNTLISYFCEKGDFVTADKAMKKMLNDRIVPNVVTYGALINAYCREGNLDKAMKIFKDMSSASRVSAHTVVYNILINAFCKSDKVEVALSLMDDMKEKAVRPNTSTYNAMLKGLQERNWLEKAFKLMDQMTEQACNPDYVTMEILTEWLSAVGQTEKLRSFVQGYAVSASTA